MTKENTTPEMPALRREFESRAFELGFEAVGVAPVDAALRKAYIENWVAKGRQGSMDWFARSLEKRLAPALVLEGAQAVICLGLNYYRETPPMAGRYARYALGADYHKVLLKKLKQLCLWLQKKGGRNKPYVDTGPVLEKPLAAAAGLGWQGKHTNLIHPRLGNWLFLGEILTTLPLLPDAPQKDRCGTCRRCIDICPTQAITAPYQLDARKCISYLTIEHREAIPEPLRPKMGDHLFGCDDCLEVCPWNRWAQETRESKFALRRKPDARELLRLTPDQFEEIFAGTPIRRTGWQRMRRNAAVVLGNIGCREDLPLLQEAALNTGDALTAEHARWAIGHILQRTGE
jgi:epoxyqueuosine reductase